MDTIFTKTIVIKIIRFAYKWYNHNVFPACLDILLEEEFVKTVLE